MHKQAEKNNPLALWDPISGSDIFFQSGWAVDGWELWQLKAC